MSEFSNWNGAAGTVAATKRVKYVDPLQELIDTIKMSPEAQKLYDDARYTEFTGGMQIRKAADKSAQNI